jgi:phage terminase large subunit-like protein
MTELAPYRAEEIRREKLARRMAQLAKDAPQHIQAHARLLHRTETGAPLVAARHHAEWCYYIEAPWLHNDERYRFMVLVAPPGYAKSTWNTMVGCSWAVANRPRERNGIISRTASLAWGFSGAIQDAIESYWWRMCYPTIQPDYDRGWRQTEWWTTGSRDKANPTGLAAGWGGNVQGKRFDNIWLDDPTDWEMARSSEIMGKQREWVRNTLLMRLPPNKRPPALGGPGGDGRVVVSCTRWGNSDLVPMFEDLGFTVVTMPALGWWDRTYDPITGLPQWGHLPLWPEIQTEAQLRVLEENDPIVFELVMQGNAEAGSGGKVFDPANFQRAQLPDPGSYHNTSVFVDTAGGKDQAKGDYFAFAAIGLHNNGLQDWLVHLSRDRLTAPQQVATCIQQAELVRNITGRLDSFIVEQKNEGIALHQQLAGQSRLPLIEADGNWSKMDKEWRAIPLSTAYTTRRMWHPLGADGTLPRWVRTYESEAEAFPNGRNDDQIDAAAGAYQHSQAVGPRIRVLSSH